MDELTPPPLPSTVVQVSAAQVWSAAAQNLLIAGIVGYLMAVGKVSTELGLPALLAIAGIDLLGRFKAKASPLAALAIGATSFMSKLPHTLVAIAFGTALFSSCAALGVSEPKSAEDVAQLVRTTLDQGVALCQVPAFGKDASKVCDQLAHARSALGQPTHQGGNEDDAGAP